MDTPQQQDSSARRFDNSHHFYPYVPPGIEDYHHYDDLTPPNQGFDISVLKNTLDWSYRRVVAMGFKGLLLLLIALLVIAITIIAMLWDAGKLCPITRQAIEDNPWNI